MTTVKTWLASAALVGGAGGGAFAGLAAVGDGAQPAAAARPATATPNTVSLQGQVDALLQEDHALKLAVQRARVRLAGQVHAGERSLAALHQRIVAAQNALAQAQAARARAGSAVTFAPAPAPASTTAVHATTGASGAGAAGGESESSGGGDD
ncbi:MAG TPA: hypothetical protein VFH66_15510 [Mycobacteriales bacterium]|nr:hypothetical protein [Mycobacteriales bacterium]